MSIVGLNVFASPFNVAKEFSSCAFFASQCTCTLQFWRSKMNRPIASYTVSSILKPVVYQV